MSNHLAIIKWPHISVWYRLKLKEKQACECLAAGLSWKAIAYRLNIETAQYLRKGIYHKTGLSKATKIASWVTWLYLTDQIELPGVIVEKGREVHG